MYKQTIPDFGLTDCEKYDLFVYMSRDARKPVFGISDQVRHKLTYTLAEES